VSGNMPIDEALKAALHSRVTHPSEVVREHVAWALSQAPSTSLAASQSLQ
jgi:epoxyqueuosine reductase QueG